MYTGPSGCSPAGVMGAGSPAVVSDPATKRSTIWCPIQWARVYPAEAGESCPPRDDWDVFGTIVKRLGRCGLISLMTEEFKLQVSPIPNTRGPVQR